MEGVSEMLELLLAQEEKLQKEVILYTDTSLPIEKGQILGECNYYIEDILLESVPLVAQENADVWTLSKIVKTIILEFLTFSSQTSCI